MNAIELETYDGYWTPCGDAVMRALEYKKEQERNVFSPNRRTYSPTVDTIISLMLAGF